MIINLVEQEERLKSSIKNSQDREDSKVSLLKESLKASDSLKQEENSSNQNIKNNLNNSDLINYQNKQESNNSINENHLRSNEHSISENTSYEEKLGKVWEKSMTKPQSHKLNDTGSSVKADKKKIQLKEIKGLDKIPHADNELLTSKSQNSFSNFEMIDKKLNKKKVNNKTQPPKSNQIIPGERLYKQFMTNLPKKQDHIKKIYSEKVQQEMKEARFSPQIDKKSNRIASNSPDAKEKVEDRLIKYGQEKRDKLMKEKTKKKINDLDFSYHPEVGEKSMIMAQIKRKERLTDLSNISVTNNQTFTTEIDDRVNSEEEFVSKAKDKNSFVSSDYTFTNMKSRKKEDVSFRTDKSMTRSDNNKSRTRTKTPVKLDPDKSIHDCLYLEAKLIEEKKKDKEKKHMNTYCPFKPNIPESSKKLAHREETKDQFIKRLINSKKEAEELIVRKKSQVETELRKKMFKPCVGRPPKDPKTRDVTVNLDGYYDQKVLSHKTKVHEEEMLNNLEKKKLFLERSMKSILKMKIEKYKEIFDDLDSDKDGFISTRHIRLSTLDSEMLTLLTPLLEDLQRIDSPMNFKTFCLKADSLISVKIFNHV
jgi:hypothetical protein